jgi:hypothetical protein
MLAMAVCLVTFSLVPPAGAATTAGAPTVRSGSGATTGTRGSTRRASAKKRASRAAADSLRARVVPDTIPAYEPELFLSWRQPYGMPGASDTLTIVPGDTSRTDTLFLSFDPGRDAPKFFAMYGRLYFHPQMGDTLGTYWHWERGWYNQGNMRMEFDNDGTFPCLQPFVAYGMGAPLYEFAPGVGRLDLIYAVRAEDAAPVAAGTRYCFARVLFRQKKSMLPGSTQPICLEWAEGRLSFGGADVVTTNGEHRWVTVNSPNGALCGVYRRNKIPATWHPKDDANFSPSPGR